MGSRQIGPHCGLPRQTGTATESSTKTGQDQSGYSLGVPEWRFIGITLILALCFTLWKTLFLPWWQHDTVTDCVSLESACRPQRTSPHPDTERSWSF